MNSMHWRWRACRRLLKRIQASKNGSMTGLMMGTGGTLMWKPGLFGMTSWVFGDSQTQELQMMIGSQRHHLCTHLRIQSLKKAGGKATVGGSHAMSLEKAGGRAPHGGMSLHPQSLGKAHLVSGQKRIGNNGTTSSLIPGEGTWSGQGLQT